MNGLRRGAALASLLIGLVTLGGGIAHVVGVTNSAIHRGGLFDTRHTLLLLVGWTLVAPGAAFVACGAAMMRRGRRVWPFPVALAVGGFLFVEFLLVGTVLGTPAQTIPAYVAAIAYLVLVSAAWRAARERPQPSTST